MSLLISLALQSRRTKLTSSKPTGKVLRREVIVSQRCFDEDGSRLAMWLPAGGQW